MRACVEDAVCVEEVDLALRRRSFAILLDLESMLL